MTTTTRPRVTIEVPGATLTFIERRQPTWGLRMTAGEYNRDWREYKSAPRMYVSVGDESILENLANRCRRPFNVYKTMIHSSGIGRVLNLSQLRWSKNAGCTMCPCSPGFILSMQDVTTPEFTFTNFDVWVTLDGAPSVDERKAPRVLAGV